VTAAVRRWHADERGQMGGIEVLPFGFLIFVVGALLIANAWGVVDAKLATDAAAREAARTFVEVIEGDDASAARAAARAAGDEAAEGHGRSADRMDIRIEAPSVARCAVITAVATYEVPAIPLPWIGGFGDGITVRSRHSERIDPFRDDVAGPVTC
jgi:hypothetical protein